MFRKLCSARLIVIISLIIGILGTSSLVYAQQAEIETYRIAVDQRGNMRLLGPDQNGNLGNEPKEHEFEIKLPSSGHVNKLVTDLKSILFQVADNVSALQDTVGGLAATVGGLVGKTSDLANTVSELEGKVNELESRITELEGGPGNIPPEGPVLWLPMDEGQGIYAYDKSGSGNHGVITNATWVPLNGTYALSFDGVDDKISIGAPSSLNFGAGSYTVEAWMFYTTAANDKPLFNAEDAIGRRRINLRSSAFSRHAIGEGIQEKTWIAPTANVWHHIVGVYDSAAQTLEPFIDGVSQGTTGSVTGTLADATENEIGYWTTLDFKFAGTIGEIRIYNRALTSLEIEENYLSTKSRYR